MTLPDARNDSWSAITAVVAGIGITGFAAADALLRVGAQVLVVDGSDDAAAHAKATELTSRGADVRLGADASTGGLSTAMSGVDIVVASPGWQPGADLLVSALERDVPVWSEIELAWRLRDPAVPWLAVTGTNGKTTTVQMLASMLRADGYSAVAAGNVGRPLVTTVLDGGHDILAVETSSFQLHFTHTMAPAGAVLLNIAPDHLDWHGSYDAYLTDKSRVYRGAAVRVYNVDMADTIRQGRASRGFEAWWSSVKGGERGQSVGFTLGEPEPDSEQFGGMLGVSGDRLIDRAFGASGDPTELASISDIPVAGPHNVANALAAAALARSVGASPEAIRDGLRAFQPEPHRVSTVATIADVTFVDDSKATNPHAAAASLSAFGATGDSRVVWVAGGLAKGAEFDDLVLGARDRLRGVVLIGADRAGIRDSLTRHAPDVPVVDVATGENDAMDHVVEQAMGMARPGDTVLLAPACASMDMFANYAVRGDVFADAVRRYGRR